MEEGHSVKKKEHLILKLRAVLPLDTIVEGAL